MASRGSQRLTYVFVATQPAVLNIRLAGGTVFLKKDQAIRTNDAGIARELNSNASLTLAKAGQSYTVISEVIT